MRELVRDETPSGVGLGTIGSFVEDDVLAYGVGHSIDGPCRFVRATARMNLHV